MTSPAGTHPVVQGGTAAVVGRARTEESGRRNLVAPSVALGLLALAAAAVAPTLATSGPSDAVLLRTAVVVLFTAAGLVAAGVRPAERQGLILLVGCAAGGLAGWATSEISVRGIGVHSGSAVVAAARLVEPVSLALLPVVAMHLLLGLPDGNCRLRRSLLWAGYAGAGVLGLAVWVARPALPAWPYVIEACLAVPAGAVASQRRYARSAGPERQRLQWFGWAVAIGCELLLVAVALRLLFGWPTGVVPVLAVCSVPLAVAVALGSLRKLAGHIDRILAHTVSAAGLTGVVVAVYLVIVLGLGGTPSRSDRSLLALSMAAAVVAALFYGPVRERLSQYANRIVYGERDAPDAVLRTFGSRLSRAVPMDELLLQVAESLRKTLNLASAEVWTGSAGHLERTVSVPDRPPVRMQIGEEELPVVARAGVTGNAWLGIWLPALLEGRQDGIVRVAPTIHSGHLLGLIVVERTAGGDSFTEDDDTMLTELARQVGLAMHNVELDSALQQSLDEVRRQADELQASRARIVAASDAARRQIERNLHDGAQQHLVALAVNVRLARRLADTDPVASGQILDQLGVGLQEAVQELRALAHGIYPPLLVDRGIAEALQSAAGRAALPTLVKAEGLGRYSPEQEAAVYFCCMEALQNAGKYAGEGATVALRVWEDSGAVLFEVADTGAGFDPRSMKGKGAGFVNMNDRVGAIGGTVSIRSAPGAGTTVVGRIPVGVNAGADVPA